MAQDIELTRQLSGAIDDDTVLGVWIIRSCTEPTCGCEGKGVRTTFGAVGVDKASMGQIMAQDAVELILTGHAEHRES